MMNTAKVGTSAGRLQTGSKVNPDALKTIGFTTNVRVEERAVTRQGLEGLKNKKDTGKINRKIQDKYYYTELLKKKINEITNEIGNMRNEIDYINQDVTAYNNMNKTYETLSKDVQNLEGELADYNLAGDKYRSMMRAEDIEAVFNHIKINNKKKREESDYLYLEKAKVMEEVHKTEYEINKIMQAVDQKLLELDPEQKIEYEQLKEENSTLMMKILDQREELNRLNMEIMEGENLLKNNPNKREASRIKDVINQLLRKKEELEFQTNESGLSVEDIKQRLITKIKDDSTDKTNIDKKIVEIKKFIDSIKKQSSDVEKEMKANTNNENAKAHESIFQKDKEYSNFIENFDSIKKNHLQELHNKEEVIVALLENISERILTGNNSANNNPGVRSVKADLDYKKDLIQKSVSTLDEAKAQYEALQVKMDRLDNLDETLKKEIKSYKDRSSKANKDITDKYDRIDFYRDFYKTEQVRMNDLLKYLERNKEHYNKILTGLILKHRSKSTQLEDNDTFKGLRELEKKIQESDNYIFSIQNFIESKSSENEYGNLMKECIELQQEINGILIKMN